MIGYDGGRLSLLCFYIFHYLERGGVLASLIGRSSVYCFLLISGYFVAQKTRHEQLGYKVAVIKTAKHTIKTVSFAMLVYIIIYGCIIFQGNINKLANCSSDAIIRWILGNEPLVSILGICGTYLLICMC